MDIADKTKPKPISHWTNSPPYTGFMHTAVPLFERDLMIVTDESTENKAEDWPKLVWVLDARDEKNLVSISTCPLPPVDAYANRGGRFGAHNIHENPSVPTAWQSDQIVIGTFFNGGLRAYDIWTNAASFTRSTAIRAGCTYWRWISERGVPLIRRRAFRPQTQARTRRARPCHYNHRLSGRGEDNASQALP
jgi:hypothetical protein